MRTPSTSRRRLAVLLPTAALVASVLATTPNTPSLAASTAPTAERAPAVITVNGFGRSGLTVVDTMGYDLKQPGSPDQFTKAAADTLFGTSGAGLFNLVRIPVYAAEAHPRKGFANIRGSAYADHVAAIKRITGYQSRVKVFASLRLVGNYARDRRQVSFPSWAKSGGHADPAAYSQLLFDYLRYMDDVSGIEIDYLGIDNERYLNDGQITPARYNDTVSRVKAKVQSWNKRYPRHAIHQPKFVASDNYRPDTEWVGALSSTSGGWSNAGVVGVHWYSKNRDLTRGTDPKVSLRSDFSRVAKAARDHGKPVWQNEYHFDDAAYAGNEYALNVRGVLGASDNFDRGTSGFTWWSYSHYCAGGTRKGWCDPSARARLQQRIAATTYGAKILPAPTDLDGAANDRGRLVTRAFRRFNTVSVWITNDTSTSYSSQAIRVPGFDVPAGYSAPLQQWTRTATSGSDNLGWTSGSGRPSAAQDVVRVTVPAHSITIVQLPAVTVS